MPYYASFAELAGDEDVDALAGYACVPWPSVALAAAGAAAAWQPSLGDHPQVPGEPDIGHPDLVIVFDGERVQARGIGNLADRCPFAPPASGQIHIEAGHPQVQRLEAGLAKVGERDGMPGPGRSAAGGRGADGDRQPGVPAARGDGRRCPRGLGSR